jgi:CheY-like chemotaxis protein
MAMQDGEVRLPERPKREACEAFHAGLCPVLTGQPVLHECGCYHDCVINGATALVADDDPDVRHLNTRVLQRIGMTVLSCSDGLQACDAFVARDWRVDVVVLDVAMPNMNGLEVCRAIRARNTDVPVVFVTGYDGTELGTALDELGVNALVTKPFRIEQLRHVVGSMVCPFMGEHLFGGS